MYVTESESFSFMAQTFHLLPFKKRQILPISHFPVQASPQHLYCQRQRHDNYSAHSMPKSQLNWQLSLPYTMLPNLEVTELVK